jgi:ParB family chromosome partitioning protein
MIPQHLSNSQDHPTPSFIVEAARQVLGAIDLDPASCAEANKVVRAGTYFAPPHDGMTFAWDGSVFLNPPGGKAPKRWEEHYKSRSSAVVWWRKLTDEYLEGRCHEAIFVGFNLDILQASQGNDDRWPDILKFPLCVPRRRIAFSGKDPTHGNVIVYFPGKPGSSEKFERAFRDIGSVRL